MEDGAPNRETMDRRAVLAALAIVIGGMLMAVTGVMALETAQFQSQPELSYGVEPSLQYGHLYEDLSTEAQALTREGVEASDGRVTLADGQIPSAFLVATNDQTGAELGRTSTHVLYERAVYRVTTEPPSDGDGTASGNTSLVFVAVEDGYATFDDLSPRGREVFTGALTARPDRVEVYRPSPNELSPAYIESNPGQDMIYVRYEGSYYTLDVDHEREGFVAWFYLLAAGLVIGSVLVGVGAISLLAGSTDRRILGGVGFAIVAVPTVVVHLPLLSTPGDRPVEMLGVGVLAGLGVAAVFISRTSEDDREEESRRDEHRDQQ